MTTDEAKRLLKGAVTAYQRETGKQTYLQKFDYFFYAGALTYAQSDSDVRTILGHVRLKLEQSAPTTSAY